ncbi:tetratricopeptide repeat protein [Erythrobacter sp.]|uniref:tetratricopeptide repeat protein n=1 Tax=Erythrobacter sp. TaxID=1042 RepID=UPI0025E8F5AA|nr:tetratricopeptide repeat protein [Erythrobacter sp.]
MTRLFRWPLIALLAILTIALLQWMIQRGDGEPAPAFAMERPAFGPATYPELLAVSNDRLALSQARVERGPNEWLPRASAGAAALSLFRLTGRIGYLDMAEAQITAVRNLAPSPSGVPELRAELALAQHDRTGAARDLDILSRAAVTPEKPTLSEAAAMRGDLALYSGDHAEAARLYRQAAQIDPHISVSLRIANLQRVSGEFDAAIATLAEATRTEKHTPVVLSGIALQTGMIASARGDYLAARDWYDRAEALFPGHWLTTLYRAEARLANGQTDRAIADLETIARDHGRPEAMDMLAFVWRVRGDATRSRDWARKSGAIWQEWTGKYPTAFAAHAAEHELVFGDLSEALRLARINAQARPFGEARLLLARALMANDQARAALTEISLAERSGWRSAQLYAIKAQALTILGEPDAADVASEQARVINPKINDPATRLIWLAHG